MKKLFAIIYREAQGYYGYNKDVVEMVSVKDVNTACSEDARFEVYCTEKNDVDACLTHREAKAWAAKNLKK